jgi:hypothetical protein
MNLSSQLPMTINFHLSQDPNDLTTVLCTALHNTFYAQHTEKNKDSKPMLAHILIHKKQ